MAAESFRVECDPLGEREVPQAAYYGVHTLRAKENFQISGTTVSSYPELIAALAAVKQAAAEENAELGLLSAALYDAISAACIEIRDGRLHDQFAVDIIQGRSGTSTNMKANEVICNRALELMGHQRGEYGYIHPNEHVNLAQSTNDVYPTALRTATPFSIEHLLEAMTTLHAAFAAKALEFAGMLKLGRTQLQDAVPMTLGQEFSTYAVMGEEERARLREASVLIREINLGATAIGAGITARPNYAQKTLVALNRITGIELSTTLAERCIKGITANPEKLREALDRSLALATALNPYIGYKNSTSVAAEAHAQGTTIREVVLRRRLLAEAQLDEALRPEALIQPRVYASVISRAEAPVSGDIVQ